MDSGERRHIHQETGLAAGTVTDDDELASDFSHAVPVYTSAPTGLGWMRGNKCSSRECADGRVVELRWVRWVNSRWWRLLLVLLLVVVERRGLMYGKRDVLLVVERGRLWWRAGCGVHRVFGTVGTKRGGDK